MKAGYEEGPESTFSHQGVVYKVDDLLKVTRRLAPAKDFPLSELVWMVDDTSYVKQRVQDADLKYPVLVTEYAPGKFVTLDGYHRVVKAVQAGHTTIKAVIVPEYLVKQLPSVGSMHD